MNQKNGSEHPNQLPLTLRLVLDVTYTTNQVPKSELQGRLQSIASNAYANGQLTGDTEAEVDTWTAAVTDMAAHPGVFPYLDVSTTHISQDTSQLLETVSGTRISLVLN